MRLVECILMTFWICYEMGKLCKPPKYHQIVGLAEADFSLKAMERQRDNDGHALSFSFVTSLLLYTEKQVVLPFVPMFHVLSWGTPFALMMSGILVSKEEIGKSEGPFRCEAFTEFH